MSSYLPKQPHIHFRTFFFPSVTTVPIQIPVHVKNQVDLFYFHFFLSHFLGKLINYLRISINDSFSSEKKKNLHYYLIYYKTHLQEVIRGVIHLRIWSRIIYFFFSSYIQRQQLYPLSTSALPGPASFQTVVLFSNHRTSHPFYLLPKLNFSNFRSEFYLEKYHPTLTIRSC